MARHLTRVDRGAGRPPDSAGGSSGSPDFGLFTPARTVKERLAAAADGAPPAGTVGTEDPLAAYAARHWPDDRAPKDDLPALLRITPFRRLWLALGSSNLGDWLGLLATVALARSLAGGSYRAENLAVAGVFLLRLAPAVLLGPLAGAVADRLDRRWTLVLGDLLRCALFVTIPLVGTLGWLYVATVLIQCVALVWTPAKDATLPNLVPPQRIEAASRVGLVATYGTALVAAVVYAALALIAGAAHELAPRVLVDPIVVAIYLAAVTFLISALVLWRLDLPPTTGRARTRTSGVLTTIADGWRLAGRTPVDRGLVVGMLGALAAAGVVVGLSPTFVRDLGAGEAGFGVLVAAVLVGLTAGLRLGPRLLAGFSRRRLFGLSLICAGAVLVLLALVPSIGAAVVFAVAIGACAGVAWIIGYTVLGPTSALLQSAARVVGLLVLAAGPAIAGAIGTHAVRLGSGLRLSYNGAAWVFLLAGVLALGLGGTTYRKVDDRKGVPLVGDLLSAWRGQAFVPESSKRTLAGYLIAFEGGDGAGKSTQASLLTRWLDEDQGHEVVLTREPGATRLGVRLRELLLAPDEKLDPRTEALLFAADRADHVASLVRPAMERGAVVVTDRYVDSSIAYQGAGRELDDADIAALSRFATDGLVPDLTVLLDIPSTFSRVRRGNDPARQGDDRLEALPEDFHERVRARFLALAAAEPRRYLVLDGTMPPEEIQERIRARVRDVVPLSSKLRAQLADKLAYEELLRRRKAEAEADVLRLDAQLRGRQLDRSRAHMLTRRDLREKAERARRTSELAVDDTAVLPELPEGRSDSGETLRP